MNVIEAFYKAEKYVFVTSSYVILLPSATMRSLILGFAALNMNFQDILFNKKGKANVR